MTKKLLLFIGTKRSGSSLMVKLLNAHPNIGMCGEMDVIWLAFQIAQGKNLRQCKRHAKDGGHELRGTKNRYKEDLQEFIEQGNFGDDAMRELILDLLGRRRDFEESAIYLGEKKPVQLTSPKVYHFVTRLFPDVKFLHLIRHPKCVCRGGELPAWKTWAKANAFVADQIDRLGEEEQQRFHTLRYEDLVIDPNLEMADLFKFLNLPKAKTNFRLIVKQGRNKKHDSREIPDDPLVHKMLNRFCYSKELATIADGG